MPSNPLRIAVVDDESLVARAIGRLFEMHGFQTVHLQTPAQIEALIATAGGGGGELYDVILLDISMPSFNGLEVLHRLRGQNTSTAIVMLTSDDTATTATAALRAGAYHYLVKGALAPHFVEVVRMAAAQTALVRALRAPPGAEDVDLDGMLVGTSPGVVELRHQIRQVAGAGVNVLVTGESGAGKEVVARGLHQLSPRAAAGFVPINCGGIPEGLIDSELFGHVRGSFTGATASRPGVFVEADGGTLFLDEIGDMPLAVQARLLRAIQHGEVRPVGGDAALTTDVRVIAATNVDLDRAVAAGRFRADLLFRLNVVTLVVPPLRERRADLPALTARLLQKHAPGADVEVSSDALDAMYAHSWPGNVRELENALLHALAMKSGDAIEATDLPPTLGHRRVAAGSGIVARVREGVPLTEAKRAAALEFERTYLLELMERAHGSVSAAARLAGLDRTNFRRLLQRHAIDSAAFRN